ncbi:hypothetical protein PVAP13_4KG184530 [Panicum virgatum]|uniref:Uncharacterized protein n=1 Tax=Panicum virgatum TaxID=38727 RepID=A0A8T0TPA8_PANVG|nr:hypothetical protein PVAP13_4KG184530 [Panicum virgatum]
MQSKGEGDLTNAFYLSKNCISNARGRDWQQVWRKAHMRMMSQQSGGDALLAQVIIMAALLILMMGIHLGGGSQLYLGYGKGRTMTL